MSARRLRLLRQINEVSLEKLAEIVDVAPQQIQKYEIGETRISASRIFELSRFFRVPIAWFYDDLEAATSAEMFARIGRHQSDVNAPEPSRDGSFAGSPARQLLCAAAARHAAQADRSCAHAVRDGRRTRQVSAGATA